MTSDSHSNPMNLPLALVCLSAFLAPILGGNVSVDAMILDESMMGSVLTQGLPPLLAHALISLPLILAIAIHLLTRKVVQIPFGRLVLPLLVLAVLSIGSIAVSSFRSYTLPATAEWLIYLVAILTAVAVSGRKGGPVAVLAAFVSGCAIVAALGVIEYGQMRPVDPSWRVFSTWVNPNALAGMLLPAVFVGCGLALRAKRHVALALWALSLMILLALMFTQSTAGLLSLAVGVVAFALASLVWIGARSGWKPALAPLLLAGLALSLVTLSARSAPSSAEPGGSGLMQRVSDSSGRQAQSFGFRLLLWKSSVALIASQPVGYGMGTFRAVSSAPGIVPPTHMAHNSLLQIGVEIGALGLLALLALFVRWCIDVWRGARRLAGENLSLRIGVWAGVFALATHSLFDSDLHVFGTGFSFFLLMGVGLAMAADGITPEQMGAGLRRICAGLAAATWLVLIWQAASEASKWTAYTLASEGEVVGARNAAKSAQELTPGDGEASYLLALYTPQSQERLHLLERAAELTPTPKHLRALAREQLAAKNPSGAITSLKRSLKWDPNNLLALKQLLELYQSQGNREEALATAQSMIEVESKPYFTVRALPQLVPTETYAARMFLAQEAPTWKQKIDLLKPALEGYKSYLALTVPEAKRANEADPPVRIGGMTPEEVAEVLSDAETCAQLLAAAYREFGDPELAGEALDVAGEFASSRAGFLSNPK